VEGVPEDNDMTKDEYYGIEAWLQQYHPERYVLFRRQVYAWGYDPMDKRTLREFFETTIEPELLATWKAYHRITS
jgi:hypothetical protein